MKKFEGKDEAGYKTFQLSKDSLVDWVYLKEDCIRSVNLWVIQSLGMKAVPEVGGFLFGSPYKLEHEERYMSRVEYFMPAKEVDYQDRQVLSFGLSPLLLIDRYLEENPKSTLMGWFHTHPGHTPYLSGTDLKLHNGFFGHPFQLAIVLDSMTPNFETGIFTRKTDGNMIERLPRSHWIKWKKLA